MKPNQITSSPFCVSGKSNALVWGVAVLLVLYIGSYAVLSWCGCYVPESWGLGWVKTYAWAPQGFSSGPEGTERNRFLGTLYLPLLTIDNRLVHTQEKMLSGKCPINTLLDRQLHSNLNAVVVSPELNQYPQGGANGEQSFGSETNSMPAAAVSRRSP